MNGNQEMQRTMKRVVIGKNMREITNGWPLFRTVKLILAASLITTTGFAAETTKHEVANGRPKVIIRQWEVLELSLKGTETGNPFLDVTLEATFNLRAKTITAQGFYDGNRIYKIRFMPDALGEWSYKTKINEKALDGVKESGDRQTWGLGPEMMTEIQRKNYLSYAVNRLAAYNNIWWSMANEYDLIDKSLTYWELLKSDGHQVSIWPSEYIILKPNRL
ncbi:MAG: DUF5060 domain-containing protein [Bacteroidota bacterium]